MAPTHDEIVKETPDGFTIAWDTTAKQDDARIRAVDKVVKEQATVLGELFGAADLVIRDGDEVVVVEIKTGGRPQSRQVRPKRPARRG